MATLADYLRQQRVEEQPQLENLLRNLSTYSRNQQLLGALGRKDVSKPEPGLLTKTLNVLGAPGRLAQAAVLEAAGFEIPGTRGMSTPEVLAGALRGDVQVSASMLPGFKTDKRDSLAERLGKGAAAFAVDVATDPLSFISAPSSISRKAAATQLFRATAKADFIDDLLTKGSRGEGLIDEILQASPLARTARLNKEAGIADDANEALLQLTTKGAKQEAAETLASSLAETLLTDGRQGLLRRLEEVTGSPNAALSVFKSLPEEVRGGVVLAGITGKPVQRKGGEYIRLTSGADFFKGPLGEAAQKARLAAAVVPGNVITRAFSGVGGDILADIKKRRLAQMFARGEKIVPGTSRFIDYVSLKDALRAEGVVVNNLQSRVLAATIGASNALNKLVDEADKPVATATFRQYFFSPAQKFDAEVASEAERVGFQAAAELRQNVDDLYQEALDEGVELGEAGLRSQYSPLMLTEEGRKYYEQVGMPGLRGRFYVPESGRDSFVRYIPDQEEAARVGYVATDDPNVVYLNAIAINDELEKAALASGRTADQAKQARVFEEDPIKVMARYGSFITNRIASKRFVDGLTRTGTLLRATPQVDTLLREREAAQAAAGISTLLPEARQAAERRLARIDRQLADTTAPSKLDDLRRRIEATRTQLTDASGIAKRRVAELSQQVAEATADVAEATPRINQLRARLTEYSGGVQRSTQELAERQRAARNVRARLATANKNAAETRSAEDVIQELYANASSGAEQAYYRELLDEVGTASLSAEAKLQSEAALQTRISAELDEIKAFRKAAREGGARDIEQMVYAYEQAVTKRNNLIAELRRARAVRDEAVTAARRVERNIGLEQVENLNTLVGNYVSANAELRVFRANRPAAEALTPDVARALAGQEKVLEDRAKAAKKLLRETLRVGKSEFKEVAGKYAEELMRVADELSEEQFQAMLVLTNEEKLLDYINTVQLGARDEATVMQAMGDIWRTFAQIRDIFPESAFSKLSEAQRSMLAKTDLAKMKSAALRERATPSQVAQALADEGYSVVNKNKATRDLYATSGVLEALNAKYRAIEDPEGWRRIFNAYIDPILLAWKTAITVGRGPGYTANNVIGGMFMNYLGNVSVADTILAKNAVFKVNAMIKQIEKANPEKSFIEIMQLAEDAARKELDKVVINGRGMGDLFSEFVRLGGFNSTEMAAAAQVIGQAGVAAPESAFRRGSIIRPVYETTAQSAGEAAFRRGLDFMMTNRVQRALNNAAQSSEMILRFSAFIDGFRRTGDAMAAMDKVHILHFDYQDLAGAEQWVRRFVPFYTWMRRNVPAQLRAMVMQPGKIQRALYANENFQAYFGAEGDESWLNQVLPEYLEVSNGFASRFKFGDNNIGFYLRLPFEDINRLFSVKGVVPVPRARELAGSLGLFTTPIELASGVNLQTGEKFSEMGEEVPGYYRLLGPLASRGPEGETRVPSALARGLGDIIPQLGILERLAGAGAAAGLPLDPVTTRSMKERGLTNFLNFSGVPAAAGLGMTTLTPKTISGELRRRQNVQSAEIKRAAAQLGVDTDWLRDQLDEGLSPQEIFARIQTGQGRMAKTKKIKERDRDARRRYQDLLESL